MPSLEEVWVLREWQERKFRAVFSVSYQLLAFCLVGMNPYPR